MSTVALAALDPLDTCPTPDPALARSVTAAMHAMGDSAHDMRRHAAPRDWRGDEADLARHVMTRTAHDLQGAAGAMASGAIAIGHYTNLVRTVLQPAHRALEARRSRLDSDARMMQQLAGEADDEPSGSFQDGVDAHNRQVHTLNREIRAWNRRLEAAQSSLVGSLDRADSVPEGRRIAAALSEVGYRFTTPSAPAASTETSPLTKLGHLGIDLVGLVPGLGEPADGANALWYWFEGDKVSAGASLAGMIPFLGWGAVAGKNGRKGRALADSAPVRDWADPGSLKGATPRQVREAVPDGWIEQPMRRGGGVRFLNPDRPGEAIFIEPGWKDATDKVHGGPYVKISRHGTTHRVPLHGNAALEE